MFSGSIGDIPTHNPLLIIQHHLPEGVVGFGELRDLEVPHLQIADIVHGNLELHRHRTDLESIRGKTTHDGQNRR